MKTETIVTILIVALIILCGGMTYEAIAANERAQKTQSALWQKCAEVEQLTQECNKYKNKWMETAEYQAEKGCQYVSFTHEVTYETIEKSN